MTQNGQSMNPFNLRRNPKVTQVKAAPGFFVVALLVMLHPQSLASEEPNTHAEQVTQMLVTIELCVDQKFLDQYGLDYFACQSEIERLTPRCWKNQNILTEGPRPSEEDKEQISAARDALERCVRASIASGDNERHPPQAKGVLDGRYTKVSNSVFERVDISGGDFFYSRGTNDVEDPWGEGFPIRGKIDIDGDTVTLVHPRLSESDRKFRVIRDGGHTYLLRESEIAGVPVTGLTEHGLRKFKERSMITSKRPAAKGNSGRTDDTN